MIIGIWSAAGKHGGKSFAVKWTEELRMRQVEERLE